MGKLLQKSKVKAKKRHVNLSTKCQSEISVLKVQIKELKEEKDQIKKSLFRLIKLIDYVAKYVDHNQSVNLHNVKRNDIQRRLLDFEEKDEMFWTIEQNTWY